MHPTRHARRPRLWGLVLIAGLTAAVAYGQPTPTDRPPEVRVDPKTGALVVPLGGMVRFDPKLPAPAVEIQINREEVLQYRPVKDAPPGVVDLIGRTPGLATLTFRMKDRPAIVYDVIVQPDYELLRNLIRRTVPTANVDVTPGIGNVIILSGYVTSPQDADIILRLANSQVGGATNNVINAMQVGGVQQVQIDVVVASVDRNEIRSRGFDFSVAGKTVQFNSVVSGLIGAPTLTPGTAPTAVSPDANFQLGIAPANFVAALRALRSEGVAKFLAEPRVVTQTGRPATFLAGGRQAVLSPSSGINGPGVTFEQIGVSIEVLPIVYGNGQIWLEINPINRQVNQGLGITTSFGAVPGFTEQNVRCAVMLESGQTFAIGGLIQNSVQGAALKVPVLGDLPFVGTAFSSIRYEERESELVVLVTPRLVAPLDCAQVPKRLPGRETRSPDDYELFLENVLEAPRGQRKVWNGFCYNAPYKCDPTVAAYPCVGPLCTGPNVGGGNCGPNGCLAPVNAPFGAFQVGPAPVVPPAGPAPGSVPQPIPPIPSGSGMGAAPATLPIAAPTEIPVTPVVIPPVSLPEATRK